MDSILDYRKAGPSKKLQRVQATYTAREISRQFGLSEQAIRQWTKRGLIQAAASSPDGEQRYDFRALTVLRRVRELRNRGLTSSQIEAEFHGQLNLFPERGGEVIQLPLRLSPFEEALLLHEKGDPRAAEMYAQAVIRGECVADAYCNMGILAYEANNTAGAFDHFTNALRYDPRHFEAHFNLAHLYFEAGDFRLARLHYEISSVIEPRSASAHFNLGLIHAIDGDLIQAVAALHRARECATEEELVQIHELLSSLSNAADNPDAVL